jgi:hypothetical protein
VGCFLSMVPDSFVWYVVDGFLSPIHQVLEVFFLGMLVWYF